MIKRKNSESLDSLNLYFQRLKKIKILTAAEEKELIAKAKNGDEEAFRTIIVASQRLVVKEALKYYFKGDNLLDLINEGNKGLIEALKKFDLSRENRFFTYAMWWVRSEIRRYLSKNQNLISLPDIFYNDYLNFKKAFFAAEQETQAQPQRKGAGRLSADPRKKSQGPAGRSRRDHLAGQGNQRRQHDQPFRISCPTIPSKTRWTS